MKRIFIILMLIFVVAGCSNNNEGDNKEKKDVDKEQATETNNDKKVYQIEETAKITSDLYDFDYEVTVNDFQLTKKVDRTTIEDYVTGAREEDRFAVVELTIKNISDRAYVPNEMFSANFTEMGAEGGHTSNDEFFTVGDEELAPGEELKGHLVYLTSVDYADTFVLKYEMMSDEETHFELPNPEM